MAHVSYSMKRHSYLTICSSQVRLNKKYLKNLSYSMETYLMALNFAYLHMDKLALERHIQFKANMKIKSSLVYSPER